MADHKTLPVFAYAKELPQLADIRGYLNGLGAKLDPKGPDGIVENLTEVAGNLQHLAKCLSGEVDAVLNSVTSLIVTISAEDVPSVVAAFCSSLSPEYFKGSGWGSNGGNVVRVLSNLFHAFAPHPSVQRVIYQQLIEVAGRSNLIGEVDCRIESLEEHFSRWESTVEEKRVVLRQIHAALLHDQRADQAAKIMLMLLGTYTDADAVHARDDATECVRTAVVDPKSFSFDQLQRLSAVKALQKSDPLMHTALELFISGTLQDYKNFVAKHPEFISQKLKVDEPVLLKKIRLLTLMTIAEGSNVITLEELSKKLELPNNEDLEEFIIDALQTKAITGKMNEISRELHITSYQHRKFGKEQWISLQKRLETLITNLETTQKNIENINNSIEDHIGGIIA